MTHDLQSQAGDFVEELGVPAVSIAVWRDGELSQGAAGVLNLDTGVEATCDAIHQIGSITKVMTTSLIMRLVDCGRVELDAPVRRYLRDFQIADRQASEAITVRQLLNHTSGIAGDSFPDDDGAEGNLIARFVDRCNALPLVHPVGEMFSYSNAAFSIAGRLAEVLLGVPWAVAMRQEIFEPLGMAHAVADPKEVIRFRTAMGHVDDGAGGWKTADICYLPIGMAPCGSTPTMRAADLIQFAKPFLDGGRDPSGEAWLTPFAIDAMTAPGGKGGDFSELSSSEFGLGWEVRRFKKEGLTVLSHGGATHGNIAMLQVAPERNAAFAVLINAFKSSALEAVVSALARETFGVDLREPEPQLADLSAEELKRYAGSYESFDARVEVTAEGSRLKAAIACKHDPVAPFQLIMKPMGAHRFAAFTEDGGRKKNMAFVASRDDAPSYLYLNSRLAPRVSS